MLGEYAVFSALAATAYLTYVLIAERSLFAILIHLLYAKVARLVFGNLLLSIGALLISCILSVTLGQVRDLEAQTMSELGRNIIVDTVIFLLMANPTVREKEVPHTVLAVSLCITISTKIIHLLTNNRVAHAAEPGPGRNAHTLRRLLALILLLLAFDVVGIKVLLRKASHKSTFYAWNLFEFASFLTLGIHNLAKLGVIFVDLSLETGALRRQRAAAENPVPTGEVDDEDTNMPVSWPWKTEHFFLIEAVKEAADLCLYIAFLVVCCLASPTRLPFYLASDLLQVIKSLYGRIASFHKYRLLLTILDEQFADAPAEKLDETCIICRDLLRQGAKVLPCGHILHPQCLKSWFVSHQTCPTCRAQITFSDRRSSTSTRSETAAGISTGSDSPASARSSQNVVTPFSYPKERVIGNVHLLADTDLQASQLSVVRLRHALAGVQQRALDFLPVNDS